MEKFENIFSTVIVATSIVKIKGLGRAVDREKDA
jgi:hypothetical protein